VALWASHRDRRCAKHGVGPGREAGDEQAWASWLAAQPNRTVVGLDANAPKVDHPDIDKNTYWGDEYGFDYQCERSFRP
jgi:hypothetical protein